jgi:hypothetical protein
MHEKEPTLDMPRRLKDDAASHKAGIRALARSKPMFSQ